MKAMKKRALMMLNRKVEMSNKKVTCREKNRRGMRRKRNDIEKNVDR